MTTEAIDLSGFTGWVPFTALPTADVPIGPGVYVVVRPSDDPPTFLDVFPAGHFKGKDPTVPIAELQTLWVPDTRIVVESADVDKLVRLIELLDDCDDVQQVDHNGEIAPEDMARIMNG